jgi:aspartyl-tRNA(Asn)/glutamyl-tRNA(Gln) amidotransferase subunit A
MDRDHRAELAWLGIAAAGQLFRRGELSPVELTRALLARIERLDPRCHSFLEVTRGLALEQAAAAEKELRAGRDRGPLHGIPYALKDLADVAGLATTCHSRILKDNIAQKDAAIVRRLREAGAVLIGKTALHEFATGGPASDLPWPPARNPWDFERHTGGSSSGSGAALAMGFAPAAIGTDTMGSIRNPATSCGVVGMKPTSGVISKSGVFPLAFTLDHVGPMTRTVEDNALFLQALVAHDPEDAASIPHPAPDFTAGLRDGLKGLRIGVIEHFHTEDLPADPQMAAAFDEAAKTLARLGAKVKAARLSPQPVWAACGRVIQLTEQYVIHERWLKERPLDYCALSRTKLVAGAFIPASDYVKARQAQRVLREEFERLMRDYDAVICLSSHALPGRFDDPEMPKTYERQSRMPFNITGTPALAVPTGFSREGLPLGMQIAGRAFAEAMVYRVAWQYEEATGWTRRRPREALA